MSIRALVKNARDAAAWRGHDMKKFAHLSSSVAIGECKHCKAWVQVLTRPAPNEIDIGGPAVAVSCAEQRGMTCRTA